MPSRNYAQIIHRARGRVRIRIPARRHHAAYFNELRANLLACEGVLAVQVNPLTATVLIEHNEPCDVTALNHGLDLANARPEPVCERQTLPPVARIDAHIRTLSGGEMDLGALIVKVALALISRQPGGLMVELGVKAATRSALWLAGPAATPVAPAGLEIAEQRLPAAA
ncbi:hypothetical protein GGE07_006023 [Sinorhizobium terangae]|uniref:Uncharacterized protein n=1 Tax=Sinorhizobium terangae TaxID=110322 RepID=A0A6N7LP56_SINTE|nr:hypothetical protein [Sinorhizobium terangae]MBB4189341.1 hypothetical protein [Sinorhizobium terangae]MQX18978.1 hypothetical protein [Sinorhizobium terangae]MQX19015.1 hypothetical protein [Sinorhizobium terangae]